MSRIENLPYPCRQRRVRWDGPRIRICTRRVIYFYVLKTAPLRLEISCNTVSGKGMLCEGRSWRPHLQAVWYTIGQLRMPPAIIRIWTISHESTSSPHHGDSISLCQNCRLSGMLYQMRLSTWNCLGRMIRNPYSWGCILARSIPITSPLLPVGPYGSEYLLYTKDVSLILLADYGLICGKFEFLLGHINCPNSGTCP